MDRLADYQLTRDRAPRNIVHNRKYMYFADVAEFDRHEIDILDHEKSVVEFAFIIADVVNSFTLDFYEQTMKCEHAKYWLVAMTEEIDSMHANKTWLLVPKPEKDRIIDYKWIYKLKDGVKPSDLHRYKARLVAKGFTQRE